MDTTKIRKRWKPEEKHMDATIDYAISEIYNLCSEIEQLQAANKNLEELVEAMEGDIVLLQAKLVDCRKAIGLLNSMILSGELHSETSRAMVSKALESK